MKSKIINGLNILRKRNCCFKINSKNKHGIKEINNAVNIACKEKIERNLKEALKTDQLELW